MATQIPFVFHHSKTKWKLKEALIDRNQKFTRVPVLILGIIHAPGHLYFFTLEFKEKVLPLQKVKKAFKFSNMQYAARPETT